MVVTVSFEGGGHLGHIKFSTSMEYLIFSFSMYELTLGSVFGSFWTNKLMLQ